MKMSAECRQQITEPSEGLRLKAYKDIVGVWTIGYGHTSRAGLPKVYKGLILSNLHTSRAGLPKVYKGLILSAEEADQLLAKDLASIEDDLTNMLSGIKGVKQNEFDALCDWGFNVGAGAVRSSSLLRAYRYGNKALAAEKFMDWTRAGGKVVGGLVTRRRKDQAWFVDGRLGARTTTQFLDFVEEMPHKLNHPDGWMDRIDNWLSIGD